MDQDFVYRFCKVVKYPWVSRIDRSIYEEYPQLDPVILAKRSFFVGLGGYAVGRVKGWNRPLCTFISILPLFAKFLMDQWKLSSKLPAYGDINFKKMPKLSIDLGGTTSQQSPKQEQQIVRFTTLRKLPQFPQKILSAKDVVSQLQSQYFK